MGSGIFGAINYRSRKYPGGLYLVRQLGDIRSDPSRLSSDTSHVAGNRRTEEKYEHTS